MGAVYTLRQHDDDDRPLYECSSCPAIIRATRQCPRWPPPEVERLMEIAPTKVPRSTTAAQMMPLLKSTPWQVGEERGLASQVQEALAMAALTTGTEPCPVLEITEVSARWLRHYGRCQAFGNGMGGMEPPGATIQDSTLRDVHAFTSIKNENERLRKLEKPDPKVP